MPRPRKGVVEERANGRIYIRDAGDHFRIIAQRNAGQRPAELRAQTLEAAQAKADRLEREGYGDKESQPFHALMDAFLKHCHEQDLSPETLVRYESALRTHFRFAARVPCRDIDRTVGEQAVAGLRAKDRAVATEASVRGVWTSLVRFGVDYDWLPPGRSYRIRTKRRADVGKMRGGAMYDRSELPTTKQVHAMADAFEDRYGHGLLVRWLALVGSRTGETLALTVGDLDLDARTVTFTKALVEAKPRQFHLRPYLKAGDHRIVVIPQELVEELARWIEGRHPDDLLFPEPGKGPRDFMPKKWLHARWPYAGRQAGWPILTYSTKHTKYGDYERPSTMRWTRHDLRHYCATRLISPKPLGRDLDIPAAAYQIGDTVEVFMRHYVGTSEDALERLRQAM